MKGLLLRLSAVDSGAEAAVRVIAYFDELVTRRATLPDLVRATASLAECAAGLRHGAGPALRFRPDGTALRDGNGAVERGLGYGGVVSAVAESGGRVRGSGSADAERAESLPGSLSVDAERGESSAGSVTAHTERRESPAGSVTTDVGRRGSPPGSLTAVAEHGESQAGPVTADPERGKSPAGSVTADVGRRGSPPGSLTAVAEHGESPAGPVTADPEPREKPPGSLTADTKPGVSPAGSLTVDFGGEVPGQVWLERDGRPGPLDDLVLERFAIAARVLGPVGPRPAAPHLADPALVELVLGEQAADEDRTRALVLLGLDTTRPVRVVAIVAGDGRDPGADAVALVARGGSLGARVAVVGGVAAVVLQPREGPGSVIPTLREALAARARERALPETVRVGVGDAVDGLDARQSWLQARLAERFAAPPDRLVAHEDLGSLTLLAEIPVERLRSQPDVLALASLSGNGDLETLEAFCRTGSLRQAAVALHRHHSSVAARLAHVEDALGWSLDEPAGRFRARLALLARRLADPA
ncbi:PucR family transcriptional regulator [Amycolatopsis jejuensis]|uniref:PucR family transcriptional regulator n=1 Tax=Amycolatopsis jejuensis TaxID=330084 RepID=UPI00068F0BA4|nr:helix-turn-helix domain-containing protein [Amycolatopsis jejuensis]